MTEFIRITGYHPDGVDVTHKLDEFANANDCLDTFARFLIHMGYARESVRAALQEVRDEL